MRYARLLFFPLCLALLTGCSQGDSTKETVDQSDPKASDTATAEGAKAHVQKYVDRLLGGDETVKTGLLGFEAVGIIDIQTIEIVSSVPTITSDGKDVENWHNVRLRVEGVDDRRGQKVEKMFVRTVMFSNDDGYRIMGAEF